MATWCTSIIHCCRFSFFTCFYFRVMDNAVMVLLNMEGKRGKVPFGTSRTCKVVKGKFVFNM